MSYTIRIPIKFCNQQMHFFCVYVCLENRYNYVVPTYYMSGLVSYVILLLSAGIASTTVYNFNNFARIICMLCGSVRTDNRYISYRRDIAIFANNQFCRYGKCLLVSVISISRYKSPYRLPCRYAKMCTVG